MLLPGHHGEDAACLVVIKYNWFCLGMGVYVPYLLFYRCWFLSSTISLLTFGEVCHNLEVDGGLCTSSG